MRQSARGVVGGRRSAACACCRTKKDANQHSPRIKIKGDGTRMRAGGRASEKANGVFCATRENAAIRFFLCLKMCFFLVAILVFACEGVATKRVWRIALRHRDKMLQNVCCWLATVGKSENASDIRGTTSDNADFVDRGCGNPKCKIADSWQTPSKR